MGQSSIEDEAEWCSGLHLFIIGLPDNQGNQNTQSCFGERCVANVAPGGPGKTQNCVNGSCTINSGASNNGFRPQNGGGQSNTGSQNDGRPNRPQNDGRPNRPQNDGRQNRPQNDGRQNRPQNDGRQTRPQN